MHNDGPQNLHANAIQPLSPSGAQPASIPATSVMFLEAQSSKGLPFMLTYFELGYGRGNTFI